MKGKMFRLMMAIALICAMMLSVTAQAEATDIFTVNAEAAPMTREETLRMVEEATGAFYQNQERKDELAKEITRVCEVIPSLDDEETPEEQEFFILTHEGKSMRFFMETIGDPDENGRYPLYITLHGGGTATEEENNYAWIAMDGYYKTSVESGIYVACRGITDTWDLHFQDDSYPLYDRLIEAMIVNYGADPDRVYLLGFSAGGDGVYQVSPRLTDRFAAVNMSSGHPNGVSLLNLANCPISLQAGIRDYYTEDAMRSIRAAEFEKTLNEYQEKYGFGYEHRVLIHVPAGHNYDDIEGRNATVLKDPAGFASRAVEENFLDRFLSVMDENGMEHDVMQLSYYYPEEDDDAVIRGIQKVVTETLGLETVQVDAGAVAYVSQFTRNPAPEKIVWDLSTRAQLREKNSFYWLEADPSVNRGVITASFDTDTNTITVEPDGNVNGDFAILFHPALVDPSRPVVIRTGDITRTVQVNPSAEFLKASMLENGDPELACMGKIMYSSLAGTGSAAGSTWEYVDGSVQTAQAYVVHVTDQNGNPVPEVFVTFCTDSACVPQESDENGLITFTGAPDVYHIQVIDYPDGYSVDEQVEMTTTREYGEWILRVEKSAE